MKVNDALTGAVLMALGLAILWHIQGFPAMPGQRFGPAWFPGIVAAGLAACGSALVFQGVRSGAPWVEVAPWMRRRRPLAGFASVIAGLVFYILAADRLGFHLTGFVLLMWWLRVLGTRWGTAVAVAIVAPVAMHLVFYKLLRVPLPWGLVERFAF